MILTHISLINFRNLIHLEADLAPGLTIISGDNGQGKSSFLEGVYLLSIGKSYKALTEKELVNWSALEKELAIIGGKVLKNEVITDIKVGIDTRKGVMQKYARVNSVPQKPSEMVGILNAVLFSAEDIELVSGSPKGRRRYIDILMTQVNPKYLRSLQLYQKIVTQRNHVLRNIRDGKSNLQELKSWNLQLAKEGSLIIFARLKTMEFLKNTISAVYEQLSPNNPQLDVNYESTVELSRVANLDEIEEAFISGLLEVQGKELATSQTALGPHRDDIRLSQEGRDFGKFSSRGQARIAALAMRLAEAQILKNMNSHDPILLLDDVLSELDFAKRQMVMDEVSRYEQILLSTAEIDIVPQNKHNELKIIKLNRGSFCPAN